MKKGIVVLLVIIGVLLVGGTTYAYHLLKQNNVAATNKGNNALVGGDRDVHGCIASAGYSWCAAKQKCVRPWEEKCAP